MTEVFRLGSADGDAVFTRVMDMALGPDGEIYVAQPQVPYVAVFSADGEPLQTIGRAGSGPGEFLSNARFIGWRGDTFFATARRKTMFYDRDGTFVREVSFAPVVVPGSRLHPGVPLSDGRLVPGRGVSGPFFLADSVAILSVVDDGADIDTIGFVPKLKRVRVERGYFNHPLKPLDGHSALPIRVTSDGTGIVFVSRVMPEASPPRFEVLRIGVAGDTVSIFDVPWEPKRVSRSDARILRQAFGGAAAGDDNENTRNRFSEPTRERRRREAEEALELPEFFPPVRQILPGEDGTIWLLRELDLDEHVERWEVYGPDGTAEGWLEIQEGFIRRPWSVRATALRASRDELWVTTIDELHVPTIRRYALESPCSD